MTPELLDRIDRQIRIIKTAQQIIDFLKGRSNLSASDQNTINHRRKEIQAAEQNLRALFSEGLKQS